MAHARTPPPVPSQPTNHYQPEPLFTHVRVRFAAGSPAPAGVGADALWLRGDAVCFSSHASGSAPRRGRQGCNRRHTDMPDVFHMPNRCSGHNGSAGSCRGGIWAVPTVNLLASCRTHRAPPPSSAAAPQTASCARRRPLSRPHPNRNGLAPPPKQNKNPLSLFSPYSPPGAVNDFHGISISYTLHPSHP